MAYNRGYRHPFIFGIHYLGGVGDNPRTLMELAMCDFSTEIRRKGEWWKDFQNQTKREQWAEYARCRAWKIRTPSSYMDITLSPKQETNLFKWQINYVLDELAGYAALYDHENKCQVSCFERIWESHLPLESSCVASLNRELSALRSQTHSRHEPGTSVSLIDPGLNCIVYGKTLASHPNRRQLRPIPPPTLPNDFYATSTKFALLPSEVRVSPSGYTKFVSYINNLHTHHTTLYEDLEATLTAFIPLFEHVLTDLHRNNPLMQRIPGVPRYTIWEEPDEPEFSDDDEGWAAYERDLRHWVMHRPLNVPDVPDTGYPGGLEHRKHIVKLRGRNLQVIIDVSDIRLRPGEPGYPSSAWHVEGMRNERIVACAKYYTSVENITETSIQFRTAVSYPRGFAAGDSGATLRTWGIQDSDSCHQYVGSRSIHSGLGIVFPNIYQHRQTSFRLVDPTEEGHQTVVSFYLVDPEIEPIVSTGVVAPQQEGWIRDAVYESMDKRIPIEIVDQIMSNVEGLIGVKEAEKYKAELKEVREKFWEASNNHHFCIPFDIWNPVEFLS